MVDADPLQISGKRGQLWERRVGSVAILASPGMCSFGGRDIWDRPKS